MGNYVVFCGDVSEMMLQRIEKELSEVEGKDV
jgi:hypothetical protein